MTATRHQMDSEKHPYSCRQAYDTLSNAYIKAMAD